MQSPPSCSTSPLSLFGRSRVVTIHLGRFLSQWRAPSPQDERQELQNKKTGCPSFPGAGIPQQGETRTKASLSTSHRGEGRTSSARDEPRTGPDLRPGRSSIMFRSTASCVAADAQTPPPYGRLRTWHCWQLRPLPGTPLRSMPWHTAVAQLAVTWLAR